MVLVDDLLGFSNKYSKLMIVMGRTNVVHGISATASGKRLSALRSLAPDWMRMCGLMWAILHTPIHPLSSPNH